MIRFILTRLAAFSFLCLYALQLQAKDGYKIQLKFTDIKDSFVYLAHYYGKPLPTIYKTDSAKIDKNGIAILESKEKILGGIYLMLLSDKKTYFDFLLDNGADMSIVVTTKDLPLGLKFTNSPDNTKFIEYGAFLSGFGQKQQILQSQLANAKTNADSQVINSRIIESGKELVAFRKSFTDKYPQALLSKIFGALTMPVVPDGVHYMSDGKTIDSTYPYLYFKNHYWDGFDFTDDRLIHTPIYEARLEEYMTKLVLPYEDSVVKECNFILSKAKKSPELFKYSLWWLTHNAESSKIMGMDAVFVYLVENYYMKGAATWLTSEELQKYIVQARKISPNVIGNLAPEIKLPDIKGKDQYLSGVNSKYTLLVFWSPDCGHCQQEIPHIDSIYKASLKAKGVKIYAVSTYEDEKLWKEFIEKNKLTEWTHVWDPKRTSNFREDYNVYMTPILYLLDEKKIIRGKRIDYSNIAGLIEMLDKKDKSGTDKQ